MATAFFINYDTWAHSQNIDAYRINTFNDFTFDSAGFLTSRFASGYFAETKGFEAGGTTAYFDDVFYYDNRGFNFLTLDIDQFVDLSANSLTINYSDLIFSNRNDYVDLRQVADTDTSGVLTTGNPLIDFGGGVDHFYIDGSFANVTVTTSGNTTTINGKRTANLENVILNDGTFSMQQLASRGTNDSTSNTSNNSSVGNFSYLVDDAFYNSRNSDVAAAGIDPEAHYYNNGHLEGRDPNWWFDTSFYLQNNPDVANAQSSSGLNPLEHFMTSGNLTRDPMSSFDTSFYLQTNPDVAAAGINPLVHYLENGSKETRSPYEGFSSSGYLQANPDVAAAGVNPLEHFIYHGQFEGREQFSIYNYNQFDFL
jgi:hypothetical protein